MKKFEHPKDQLENSRLQSIVLDYKKTQKLAKCGIVAVAVILLLLLIFLTTGWSHYRASMEAKKTSAAVDGVDGKDGNTPYIGANGNWFIGDQDTGVSAQGSMGEDGKDGAAGTKGEDGKDGKDGAAGTKGEDGKDGKDGAAGTKGEDGKDGETGKDGADGTKGDKGEDGLTPYIGDNGNWFIGDIDTGIPATGGGSDGSGGGGGTDTTPPSGDGSFTVKLDPNQGNKSLAVSETRGFANPTDNLLTNGINDAWNITLSDIPNGTVIDTEVGGSNNGHNYFAYTFFLKNTGTETFDYNERLTLVQNELDAIKALRFMLYRDGAPTIYASPATNGSKEPFACDEAFSGNVNLISKDRAGLAPGQVVRYTIVIWFEGNDPECVNAILGGSVKLSLGFKIL